MAFSLEIVEDVLVKAGRACCICHHFVGQKIELHHVIALSEGGGDEADNAIALCFDCHAEEKGPFLFSCFPFACLTR